MTLIPPTPITSESTPASNPDAGTAMMPPAPSRMEQNEAALEQVVPVPIVKVPMQPSVDNQLGFLHYGNASTK